MTPNVFLAFFALSESLTKSLHFKYELDESVSGCKSSQRDSESLLVLDLNGNLKGILFGRAQIIR